MSGYIAGSLEYPLTGERKEGNNNVTGEGKECANMIKKEYTKIWSCISIVISLE